MTVQWRCMGTVRLVVTLVFSLLVIVGCKDDSVVVGSGVGTGSLEEDTVDPKSVTGDVVEGVSDADDVGFLLVSWGECDDCAVEKKDFGCSCIDNVDCASGWCVEDSDGGSVCTMICIESCFVGWVCKGLINLGSDITFICVL